MALGTLLVLVTFGITLVMVVTHVLGGSRTPELDEDEARLAFRAEHPTLAIDTVQMDVTGRTAVLFLADGRVGVVTRLGDHPAVRLVDGSGVAHLDAGRLRVRFDDVGWPVRELTLRSDDPDPGGPDARL